MVRHVALGYLTGKAVSKLLDVKVNIPLLFLASVLPDIDLILGLEHRGPTHSLIVYAVIFVPVFWLYGKQSVPFFASLTQHSLLGDLLTGVASFIGSHLVNLLMGMGCFVRCVHVEISDNLRWLGSLGYDFEG